MTRAPGAGASKPANAAADRKTPEPAVQARVRRFMLLVSRLRVGLDSSDLILKPLHQLLRRGVSPSQSKGVFHGGFRRGLEDDLRGTAFTPAAVDRLKRFRLGFDHNGLLFRSQFDHA